MSTFSKSRAEAISSWITRQIAVDGTPGLSLAITDRDRTIHTAAFGLADIAASIPVTTDHLFETGSIGKSFTSIALLQLADEGKIDLQAPVTEYLPWFSIQSEFDPIRLHHLLSHTAGITSGLDFAPDGTIQVWSLRDSVVTAPPGTYFHYSNIGYKVLGEVLREVDGDTYGPTVQCRILDPLGLTDSVPTITTSIRDRLAVGYGPLYDDRPWWPGRPLAPATWLETDTADGCLAMTAADLVTYLRMLLNRGLHDGRQVLSERGFELLTQRAIEIPDAPDPTWYGYGMNTRLVNDHTYIGHSGGMVGYFSGMIGDLDTGLGVVALVNGPGGPNRIARQILDYLRALEAGEPADLPVEDDAASIQQPSRYAGEWVADGGTYGPRHLTLRESGSGLTAAFDGVETPVRAFGNNAFVTKEPALGLFPIIASTDSAGNVTALMYGDTCYTSSAPDESTMFDFPDEWKSFTGHYRSHNPWTNSFRVLLRQGRLWLLVPSEPDGLEYEQPLVPLAGGWFRCGEDERIPERIRFDVPVNGKTLLANLSGCDFYRLNAP